MTVRTYKDCDVAIFNTTTYKRVYMVENPAKHFVSILVRATAKKIDAHIALAVQLAGLLGVSVICSLELLVVVNIVVFQFDKSLFDGSVKEGVIEQYYLLR